MDVVEHGGHGFVDALTHKIGPLPGWAWGLGGGVLIALYLHHRSNGGGGSSTGPLVPAPTGDVTGLGTDAGGSGAAAVPDMGTINPNGAIDSEAYSALLANEAQLQSNLDELAAQFAKQQNQPAAAPVPAASSTALTPGFGGGAGVLADASRAGYSYQGETVQPITYASIGVVPDPVTAEQTFSPAPVDRMPAYIVQSTINSTPTKVPIIETVQPPKQTSESITARAIAAQGGVGKKALK